MSQFKTLRILLAVIAAQDLHLLLLDIKTAFLNGDVEEWLYKQQSLATRAGISSFACCTELCMDWSEPFMRGT
jgi:hypothetical protein